MKSRSIKLNESQLRLLIKKQIASLKEAKAENFGIKVLKTRYPEAHRAWMSICNNSDSEESSPRELAANSYFQIDNAGRLRGEGAKEYSSFIWDPSGKMGSPETGTSTGTNWLDEEEDFFGSSPEDVPPVVGGSVPARSGRMMASKRVKEGKSRLRPRTLKENASRDEEIKGAVEVYTGRDISQIEIVADPKVRGTFAIRATLGGFENGDLEVDFLLTDYVAGQDVEEMSQNVGEVEFKTWPPHSRNASAGSALRGKMGEAKLSAAIRKQIVALKEAKAESFGIKELKTRYPEAYRDWMMICNDAGDEDLSAKDRAANSIFEIDEEGRLNGDGAKEYTRFVYDPSGNCSPAGGSSTGTNWLAEDDDIDDEVALANIPPVVNDWGRRGPGRR